MPEAVTPVRRPPQKQEVKEKTSVSITEAARILHVSTTRLRELMDQRKIYYTDYYGKRTIPKEGDRELRHRLARRCDVGREHCVYRDNKQMDAEMEEIPAKLLSE